MALLRGEDDEIAMSAAMDVAEILIRHRDWLESQTEKS